MGLELGGVGLISNDGCCQKFGLLTNGLLVIIVVTSTVGDYIHRKHKFSVYF